MLFNWMPAAMTYPHNGGLGIYVRFTNKNPNRIKMRSKNSHYVIISCPDRDIAIVGDTNRHNGFHLDNFDSYVHVGNFHDHISADLNHHHMMLNYVTDHKSKNQADARINGSSDDRNMTIVSDSGGFQFSQHRVEFINPVELTHWYNRNVDIGMVLDIPVAAYNNTDLDKSTAIIQAGNTDIMVRNKADHVELMNVIHGRDISSVNKFRDIVERDDINKVATPYQAVKGYIKFIDYLYDIITTGKSYNHYHVLGVSSPIAVLLLIRLSQKLNVFITSDSSTPVQKARTREYHTHPTLAEKPHFTLIGLKDGYVPSPYATLPCNCPICVSIKYSDVFSCLGGGLVLKMLEYHNVWSMSRYFRQMYDVSSLLPTKDMKFIMSQHTGNANGKAEAIKALSFIDELVNNKELARKRYAVYLNTIDSIFDIPSNHIDGESDDDTDIYSNLYNTSNETLEYFNTALGKYKMYHEALNSQLEVPSFAIKENGKKIKTDKAFARKGNTGKTGKKF